MDETAKQLRVWLETKRLLGLTDAQIQMARELRMKPKRLRRGLGDSPHAGSAPSLAQRIENLYLERFRKPRPDLVVPLRELLRVARVKERAEKRERKRARKRAEALDAEAARVSVTNIQRLYGG